ncbi:septal ring lytic transglycosylase RlpA family protein [Vibrio sp. SS-MA-C1-2]|uniref:septal ring lytic transglycosylase RlpA family protein n=1 Tax=Vibrio sp. SS-MA-C1-2 TaxID=2908646 RepID=UPI001F319B5E|nr:septal ring lytic transglycosylase RlpA family protein [Vibrio sp. SS-MA-C1-2]UJF18822.1 septal ring lytic transglycosylase RlpA family protein [Vibrio sp. SS-MA-C1-2]
MRVFCIFIVLLMAGCSSNSSERYDMKDDIAPAAPPSLAHIEDAQPRYEAPSKGGNKNYTVRSVNYQVLKNPDTYYQEGFASWYGKKFHGHLTSNGEIYDMYSMTAAHKTLPLPSYVKVTNKNNGKSIVVRVNDRGPFHEGRIIDLSYVAALKLDMLKTGTTAVSVELINVDKPTIDNVWQTPVVHQYMIQVAAIGDNVKANALAAELSEQLRIKHQIVKAKTVSRIQLGPIEDYKQAYILLDKIKNLGYPTAFLIEIPINSQTGS